jgi:hypothetical protein
MMAEDYEISDVIEEDIQGSTQFESTSRLMRMLPLEGQAMGDPLSLESMYCLRHCSSCRK